MIKNISKLSPSTIQELKNLSTLKTQNQLNYKEETNGRKWAPLHDLFSEQARKTPDAIAIEDGERRFTYKELDLLSDNLAGYLQQNMGVKIGDAVAIYMERSLEYIICYIAILKAGGGYLPVEMNSPVYNIKKMLKTGSCQKIISKSTFSEQIQDIKQEQPHQEYIFIDEWDIYSNDTPLNKELVKDLTLDDLAFVVLSSGSTGEPKGISAPHRASVHGYLERHEFNQYKVGDKVGCNIFFVWEILRPLLQGGTVVPIPENVIFDPNLLMDFIEKNQLSEILFTPSLLETVVNSVPKQKFLEKTKSMKTYWLNGEPVKNQLKNQLIELLPENVNILNTYSISECHDVSNENVRESRECESGFTTCGKLTDKVEVLVLDINSQEKIFERGVEGEILIGGPGVGIGYLNGPPSLNENGFPVIDGVKYFRTGDIGVVHKDGRLEIKGRCNTKIKMRGYTIFLGGVEKVLNNYLKLQSSIVIYDDISERLVGYLVKGQESVDFKINENGTCQQIRQILREKLPEYAIPQYFVEIPELPINPQSGKTNKKMLPPPPYKQQQLDQQDIKEIEQLPKAEDIPGNLSLEYTVEITRKIWSQILELEESHIQNCSNFFDIGGHSLYAVQAITQFDEIFQTKLLISTLYDNPCLEDFVRKAYNLRKDQIENGVQREETRNSQELVDMFFKDSEVVNNLQFKYREDQKTIRDCKEVLITGTTGFLGVFLLNELLLNVYNLEKVHCLVRAKNIGEGQKRIMENLKFYGLFDLLDEANLLHKIEPVLGDISQENLGIKEDIYNDLGENVDFVYHCAAAVNFVQPYNIIKGPTVDGTEQILKFCSQQQQADNYSKQLYFVSTNGILPPKYHSRFYEDKAIDDYINYLVNDGYGQTKWVAEKMIWNCENNGLKASAFRFGNIGHVFETGAKNPIDFQSQLIETCNIVNSSPDCPDWNLEATPVDFIARCMVQLAKNRQNFGKVYHIIEDDTVKSLEVFQNLQKKGLVQNIVSFEEWKTQVNQKCMELKQNKDSKQQYETVLSIKDSLDDLQKYLTDTNSYDRTQIRLDLDKFGIDYNSVDAQYYEKILE